MSASHRIQIVLNPAAGRDKALRRLSDIQKLCAEKNLDVAILRTEGPGHAAEIARKAAESGFAVVAAAGGDGTVNEVINGLMAALIHGKAAPRLAVLSIGRRNNFASGANLNVKLRQAIDILAVGRAWPLDVGYVKSPDSPEGRYFGNGLGIVAAPTDRKGAPLIDMIHDTGTISMKSSRISIMNGKWIGAGLFMAPEADDHDGYLDLCMAGVPGRLPNLTLMAQYRRGTHMHNRCITTGRSTRYDISAREGSLVAHADGELLCEGGRELSVECLASRLSLIRGI